MLNNLHLNTDVTILLTVGVCIGITITLLATFIVGGNMHHISMQDTSYEVIVEGFLGYDELMIVRRVEE